VLISSTAINKKVNFGRTVKLAKFLQNKFNSDIARFATHVRTCLATVQGAWYSFVGGETSSIAIQIFLQQCCKTSCKFSVARFAVTLGSPPLLGYSNKCF